MDKQTTIGVGVAAVAGGALLWLLLKPKTGRASSPTDIPTSPPVSSPGLPAPGRQTTTHAATASAPSTSRGLPAPGGGSRGLPSPGSRSTSSGSSGSSGGGSSKKGYGDRAWDWAKDKAVDTAKSTAKKGAKKAWDAIGSKTGFWGLGGYCPPCCR